MSETFTDPYGRVYAPQYIAFERPPEPLPSHVRTPQDLDRWRSEREIADAQVENLVAERRRVLTSASVEALRKLDDQIATARVRAERAVAVIADAEERFAEAAAERAAEEPARREMYVKACAARDEYEQLHRKVYAPAAQKIAEALLRMTELALIIEASNKALPEEAERIDAEAFREVSAGYDHRLTRRVELPGVNSDDSPFWHGRS